MSMFRHSTWWNCNGCKIIYIHVFVFCKYIGILIATTFENPITIILIGVNIHFGIIRNVLQFKQHLTE